MCRGSDHAARMEAVAFLGALATGPPAGVQLLVACQVTCWALLAIFNRSQNCTDTYANV